jgi:Mor family transcriptional regulator
MFQYVAGVEFGKDGDFMSKNVMLLTELRDALGVEKFKEFVEQHSGEIIYLPKRGEYVSLEERNRAILEGFYSGVSMDEMSKQFGIGATMIYKIVRDELS